MAELPVLGLEVVTLGGGGAGRDVALGGGQRRGGRRTPWLVAGVVVAVVAAAVVVGRPGSGSGDSSSAAPTSSAPLSTGPAVPVVPAPPTELPTAVADPRPRPAGASPGVATQRQLPGLGPPADSATTPTTAGPSTAAPSTAAVPAGPTPTVAGATEETFSAFLPARTGLVVYGLDADGRLIRVDLDRGSVSRRVLSGVADRASGPLLARGGGAIVRRGDGTQVFVPDDPGQPDVRLSLPGSSSFVAAARPDEVWQFSGQSTRTAQRLRLDGSAVGPLLTLPPGAHELGDDGRGNLLVVGIDGTYVLGPDQPTTRITTGRLLAWSPAAYVDALCDEAYACHWRITERATGAVSERGPLPDGLANSSGRVLSPDGTSLAVTSDLGAGAVVVTDLRSGQAADLGAASAGAQALTWSADGQWLIWLSPDGTLHAWSPSLDAPITVDGLGHIPALHDGAVSS